MAWLHLSDDVNETPADQAERYYANRPQRSEDATMYCVEVNRGDGWTVVGQYPTRRAADLIAADYRNRGERVRVVRD